MNKVILMGRVVRDPDIAYTTSNTCRARYTLAVEKTFKKDGEPDADFITCIAFKKNAEFAEKYLRKGMKILVEGKWQTGSYKNTEGKTVYTNECFVERHEFAESKSANQEAVQNAERNTQPAPLPTPDNGGFMFVPDDIDDLPFN